MGKTQSKRSVDITTTGSKNDIKVGITEKLEKIGDNEHMMQINGDMRNPDVKTDVDVKVDEKEETKSEDDINILTDNNEKEFEEKDNCSNTFKTLAITDEICDKSLILSSDSREENVFEINESNKKLRKEKVKKKWSFRNISFGKKDKQKPLKKDGDFLDSSFKSIENVICQKNLQEIPVEKTSNNTITGNTDTKTEVTKKEEPDETSNATKKEESDETSNAAVKIITNVDEMITKAENEITTEAESAAEENNANNSENFQMKVDSDTKSVTKTAEDESVHSELHVSFESPQNELQTKTENNISPFILSIKEGNGDGKIDDIANSYPINELENNKNCTRNDLPPPLPYSTPPSQMLVFALSNEGAQSSLAEKQDFPKIINGEDILKKLNDSDLTTTQKTLEASEGQNCLNASVNLKENNFVNNKQEISTANSLATLTEFADSDNESKEEIDDKKISEVTEKEILVEDGLNTNNENNVFDQHHQTGSTCSAVNLKPVTQILNTHTVQEPKASFFANNEQDNELKNVENKSHEQLDEVKIEKVNGTDLNVNYPLINTTSSPPNEEQQIDFDKEMKAENVDVETADTITKEDKLISEELI